MKTTLHNRVRPIAKTKTKNPAATNYQRRLRDLTAQKQIIKVFTHPEKQQIREKLNKSVGFKKSGTGRCVLGSF